MDQETLNRLRRMAGIEQNFSKTERKMLVEKENLEESANGRLPEKKLKEIAKEYCNVNDKGERNLHNISMTTLMSALKAAWRAGYNASGEKKDDKGKKMFGESDESSKEAEAGGSKPCYDPKGGEKYPKEMKDGTEKQIEKEKGKGLKKAKSAENYKTPKNKTAKQVTNESKKADKDYDKDGKIETEKEEYMGSKDRAIKAAMKKEEKKEGKKEEKMRENVGCGEYEEYEEYTSSYTKNERVRCTADSCEDGETYIVYVPDAQAEYVGIIPEEMMDASDEEKDKAVDLVRISEIRPASEEDHEMAMYKGTMEGSSEGYKNPKGTKLQSDSKSGAKANLKNIFKTTAHKDDSRSAKSEDKGTKGLKKISEQDSTVWNKDYSHRNTNGHLDHVQTDDPVHVPDQKDTVKVPANIKASLQNSIRELKEDAKKIRHHDAYRAEFYENTADVFENLMAHLQDGTKRSIALAQIDMNRVMSPMTERLPRDVYMYIVRGGKPASLTELFKEVKVKREQGADLSKEHYTK